MKLFKNKTKFIPITLVILLSFTPIVWFYKKGSALINGVDTNFPLDPLIWFERRFYIWNSVQNAGIDFSSSTAGLFFHSVQTLPFVLGFNLQTVEIISLIFWFVLIVLSSYFFARLAFSKKGLIPVLFAVLYSFNTYMFNSWENIKVANLSLVAAIPLGLLILVALKKGKIKSNQAIFFSALLGIIVSGSGINPAYFLCFLIVLAIYTLGDLIADFKLKLVAQRLKELGLVVVIIFLINLFWIVPTAHFILTSIPGGSSIDRLGYTNWVDSLSANTSLINVIRLQGAWDWYAFDEVSKAPLYIPYVVNYFYNPFFIAFSFLLPILAFASFILKKREYMNLYISFGLMSIFSIFFGSGTHEPTGGFYKFLALHVPFFSLFRSPWYIFTPLLTLATAGLISLFLSELSTVWSKYIKNQKYSLVMPGVILILIVSTLIYSYPLVTGKIFRPARQDSFFVQFPSYIFDAKQWLTQNGEGRIVSYPDDEIENFKWGYRGVESILELLVDREVLFSSLNGGDQAVSLLIKDFYSALKKGEIDSALLIAQKLNVSTLFYKRDQPSLALVLPDSVQRLESKTFGEWTFYQLPKENYLPKIYSAAGILSSHPNNNTVDTIRIAGPRDIVINPDDRVIKQNNLLSTILGKIIKTSNSQEQDLQEFINASSNPASKLNNQLVNKDISKVDFIFQVDSEGNYSPILERYKLEDYGLKIDNSFDITLDGQPQVWKIAEKKGSYLVFAPVNLSKGFHKVSFKLSNTNLVNFDISNVGSITREGEGSFELESDDHGKYFSLSNRSSKDTSANFDILNFDQTVPYLINLKYKQVYGNNATMRIHQKTSGAFVRSIVERLPAYPEWTQVSSYFEPIETPSFAAVSLVTINSKDPLGAKVYYRDLNVNKVFVNKLYFINEYNPLPSQPKIVARKESPVLYRGDVAEANGSHVIVFSENYSPDWEISFYDANDKKINLQNSHFTANFFANAWYVDKSPENYKFKIYYKNQDIFIVSSIISIIVLLLTAIIFLNPLKLARKLKK
jgi:hypothetical protein